MLQIDLDGFSAFKTDFQKIGDKYKENMNIGTQAQKKRDLVTASNAAKVALKICPDSVTANTLLKSIDEAQNKALRLIKGAQTAIQSADFQNADAYIQGIDDIWPNSPDLKQIKNRLPKIRNDFTREVEVSRNALVSRDLDRAHRAAKSALTICPNSKDASTLKDSVERDKDRTSRHLKQAESFSDSADFQKCRIEIQEAKTLWSTLDKIASFESEISVKESEYLNIIKAAESELSVKDYSRAKDSCEAALKLCPNSKEASTLYEEIKKAQDQEKKSRLDKENRKIRRRSAVRDAVLKTGKWGIVLISGGAVVIILILTAIFFWGWVTKSVWPWIMHNPIKLAITSVVLSGIASIIHQARRTNLYIEHRAGGVFEIPLFLGGSAAVISGLINKFALHGSFLNGLSFGIFLGVIFSFLLFLAAFGD